MNNLFLKKLRSVNYYTTFPSIIEKPYNWLYSNFTASGSIFDENVKSSLDHQYHLAWFIFITSVYNKKTNENDFVKDLEKAVDYLLNIDDKINRNSSSFIGIPLILAYEFIDNQKIKNRIYRFICNTEFVPTEFGDRANNFHCLKMIALLLEQRVLNIDLREKDKQFLKQISSKKIFEWQYSDGFYYDKPYTTDLNKGVPHLTYHSTIMMCVLLAAVLLDDDRLLALGKNSICALEALVSPTGEAGAYGRSNNAIFGSSSALFAISLYHLISQTNEFRCLHEVILKQIKNNLSPDGHVYIVPNKFEKKRAGFDKYMFVTVYESWAIGQLLLSYLMNPSTYNE